MESDILFFEQISAADLPHVGGKGANLGEMGRAGFPVPPGFCLTTHAYNQFMARAERMDEYYTALAALADDDVEGVRQLGEVVRGYLMTISIPPQVAESVEAAWQQLGAQGFYAVRSSATAEDLPTASFAGQQDTYLNIRGLAALLEHVRRCWVSLFTDRAILYRARNGFDHRQVQLSVVVQQMVAPDVSGILFTADPVNGHRQIVSIDASYGLGEALVAGLVTADLYQVDKRDWQIVETKVADKQLAIWPLPEGGTVREELDEPRRSAQALTPEQIVQLAQLGTQIEAHYGQPQDIEWVIKNDEIFIVQSRPITSLFPVPHAVPGVEGLRLYMSMNHAQVMTDPISPLGSSIWRVLFPFGKTGVEAAYTPYMTRAAGNLYIDLSPLLFNRVVRKALPNGLQVADHLASAAIKEFVARPEFEAAARQASDRMGVRDLMRWFGPMVGRMQARLWLLKPEEGMDDVRAIGEGQIQDIESQLAAAEIGLPRLLVLRDFMGKFFREIVMALVPFISSGFASTVFLARIMAPFVDDEVIQAVSRGIQGNPTTEMDLEVGDLADVARRSPTLVEHLLNNPADGILDNLGAVPGGADFITALNEFLARYGMRGPSEIDIARLRWFEEPTPIIQAIVGNLRGAKMGSHRQHFNGLVEAGEAAADQLVAAARQGPLGFLRARLVRRMTRVARHIMAVREYPKYFLVRVIWHVKKAVLEAAEMLLEQGRLIAIEDVWWIEFFELIEAFENPELDLPALVAQRQAEYAAVADLNAPRVMTSDGQRLVAQLDLSGLPEGALPGSPVSAGVIEGVARVVMDPAKEVLNPGEILVAPFTDPGWTPLFINAAGLAMEVGGLMTHGSVVAREYGIPAVVGVEDVTKKIKTGQRIRIQGDLGYVEILDDQTK